MPREILRLIPKKVANNPLVRGRRGAPNRWPIPKDVHREIHAGPGGGAYNQAWKKALRPLGGDPTPDDIVCGSAKGPRVPIDAAYHQEITNAFRTEWGYGRTKPTASQLQDIMQRVYSRFPLPRQ